MAATDIESFGQFLDLFFFFWISLEFFFLFMGYFWIEPLALRGVFGFGH